MIFQWRRERLSDQRRGPSDRPVGTHGAQAMLRPATFPSVRGDGDREYLLASAQLDRWVLGLNDLEDPPQFDKKLLGHWFPFIALSKLIFV